MSEVLIPPWVRPESPETIRWIDDATTAFPPAFGRGTTQRGIWADPRWGLRRRYRGLRSEERTAIINALSDSRGQLNVLRVTPHSTIAGSFSTSELVTNGTFGSGTSNWTTQNSTLTVSQRIARIMGTAVGSLDARISQSGITVTQFAPYVGRAMILQGKGFTGLSNGVSLNSGSGPTATLNDISTSLGMHAAAMVMEDTTASIVALHASGATSGWSPGDYALVPYISLARCALVDNASNLLVRSDEFDNASWTKSAVTVTANADTAPDGTSTADRIVETAATSTHQVLQGASVSSTATTFCFAVAIKAGNRAFANLIISDGTSSTSQYFNLTTQAVGSNGSTGASWSNRRAFTLDLGGGWTQCVIIARKTGAGTTINAAINAATADGTDSYTGSAAIHALGLWRGTLAISGVPTMLAQTTSSALSSGTAQTGGGLNTKGWPVSTNGLLLAGDWVEIEGELKRLTAPVNSNALGQAYVQFRPSVANSPSDNDAVIVYEPFGRFIYPQGTRELENLFGIYGDCEMNLEEVYV